MNLFSKFKRWFSRREASGNQAPSYVSTGHENPRRSRREECTRDPVIWVGTPVSPVAVNLKDPVDHHHHH